MADLTFDEAVKVVELIQEASEHLTPAKMVDYTITWYCAYVPRDAATEQVVKRVVQPRVEWLLSAVHDSKTDRETWDALNAIAQWHLRSGCPMINELVKWIAARLEKKRERPARRGPSPKTVRDKVIASTVQTLVDRGGFRPTRNNASEARSACDAVAEALGYVTYKAVEKVWNESTPSDRVLLRPAVEQCFAAYETQRNK